MGYWYLRTGAGLNKTHESTIKYAMLDSFNCRKYLNGEKIGFSLYDEVYQLDYSEIENNYNSKDSPKRLYFLCPLLGESVRYLYYKGKSFICRNCGKHNYPIQQTVKGQKLYKKQITKALKQLKYDYKFAPFDLVYIRPHRPLYMHKLKYKKYMERLRHYQNLLDDDLRRQAKKIIGADYEKCL